ncbi:hypothetical protein JS520_00105 [Candidatus Vidania fulgoroideae]|nr:hypothetical protein JS520_00105 [Candidatus Vidania fulgoroideae]
MAKFMLHRVIVDYINSTALGKCLFLDSYIARLVASSVSNVTVFTSTNISNLATYDSLLLYSKSISFDFFVRRLAFLTVYEKLLFSYFESIVIFYSVFMSSGFVDIPIKLSSKFLLAYFLEQCLAVGVSLSKDFKGNLFLRVPITTYYNLSSLLFGFFNVSSNGLFYLQPTFRRLLVDSAGVF